MKKVAVLAYYILVPPAAGLLGSLFTAPAIPVWYASLNKPPFNPPSWIFAPVWTILYLKMGYAAFLVSESKSELKPAAMKYFWLQLAANFFWSVIFFGLKMPGLAFIEIIILWALIARTTSLFYKITKKAGYLFLPYLLWVTFAMILNLSIVLLN